MSTLELTAPPTAMPERQPISVAAPNPATSRPRARIVDAPASDVTSMDPEVTVIDHTLYGDRAFLLAHRLKARGRPPGVLIHSRTPDAETALATLIAGADGLVGDGDPATDDAIRWVAGGSRWMPVVALPVLSRVASWLDRADVPILGMLVSGAGPRELADTLGLTPAELALRRRRMLGQLLAARAARST